MPLPHLEHLRPPLEGAVTLEEIRPKEMHRSAKWGEGGSSVRLGRIHLHLITMITSGNSAEPTQPPHFPSPFVSTPYVLKPGQIRCKLAEEPLYWAHFPIPPAVREPVGLPNSHRDLNPPPSAPTQSVGNRAIHEWRVPSSKRRPRPYTRKYQPAYSFRLDGTPSCPAPVLRGHRELRQV